MPQFTTTGLANGDVISCTLSTGSGCVLAVSNSVTMIVRRLPAVPAGQVFVIQAGSSLLLMPLITGDIAAYAWSPGEGLSDSTIREPLASPLKTMEYGLKVTDQDGCVAEGAITVEVSSEIKIANAFTPGKNKNNRFYVQGGPYSSVVEAFTVFNRWGQPVFRAHDVPLNDRTVGWDGYFGGALAPPGTYVYLIEMRLAKNIR